MNERIGNRGSSKRLVSTSEIARIAGFTQSAVSNWRKRFADFPAPAGTAPSGGDLFLREDVQRWLQKHNRIPTDDRRQRHLTPKGDRQQAMEQLWGVADRLRGRTLAGDVTGALAAGAALLHLAREGGQLPVVHLQTATETADWVREATNHLATQRAEFGGLLRPLEMVEPELLRLLLDSLSSLENSEQLAEALDYVFERGSRYGEFRTPEPIASLLVEIAEPRGTVFDPAVGSGELLLAAGRVARGQPGLFGQEVNESTWRVALTRLLLRNFEGKIALGDSLAEDRYPNLRADLVICEPPAGGRTADLSFAVGDPRWQLLGSLDAPPQRTSDFTWLAHVIHHLGPDGRGYVLLPASSLFRKGIEARYRAELVRQGTIEAIVTLPGGSLSGTAIAGVLWIVRPPTRSPESVLMLDATGESSLTRRLRRRLIETIGVWRSGREQFEPTSGFATGVPVLDLLAGEAPLVPSRWLYQPEIVNAGAMIAELERARADLSSAHGQLPPQPPRFKLDATAEPPNRLRVGDLIDLGLATLIRPDRIKTDEYGEEGLPVWLPGDIRDPWRREEPPRFVDPTLVDARSITEPGDIVFTTIGGIRTRVDEEGGHVLGTSLQALRLKRDMVEPYVVAALLMSEQNRRLLTGTSIPRVNVLELEIPQLDLATSKRVGEVLRAIERELETANALAVRAEVLRKTLVDTLASGAATVDHLSETGNG